MYSKCVSGMIFFTSLASQPDGNNYRSKDIKLLYPTVFHFQALNLHFMNTLLFRISFESYCIDVVKETELLHFKTINKLD